MKSSKKSFQKLEEIELLFKDTVYAPIVEKCIEGYYESNVKKVNDLIAELPTRKELFEQLYEKIKGKSVQSTLKKIANEKISNPVMSAKALSSLLTHALIECEKGNMQFKAILPGLCISLLENVEKLIYKKQ